MFALVDCNNFYASCEQLFRPDLKHKPIVVLSNNDGCVVARSAEAKALGIKMAVPAFQIQDIIQHHNVQVFSSNYAFYADISQRVMQVLEELAPQVEVYSIDEAFIDMQGMQCHSNPLEFGQSIKKNIAQWIGMPVCVGIAPTKTLAKLANYAAKKYPATQGVLDLTPTLRQRKLMAQTPVEEVWGVGRKLKQRLTELGIHTALDLAQQDSTWIRRHFSVTLARTVQELNGVCCFGFDDQPHNKKKIVCSRSFALKITEQQQLTAAVCSYAARAAEKLRLQGQQAKTMTLFIRTSPFTHQGKHHQRMVTTDFVIPTYDTRDFIAQIKQLMPKVWQEGCAYAKAGVMLSNFFDEGSYQLDLFTQEIKHKRSKELMQVMDKINQTGRGQVQFAAQGLHRPWHMQPKQQSPAYTTRWRDLPKVT